MRRCGTAALGSGVDVDVELQLARSRWSSGAVYVLHPPPTGCTSCKGYGTFQTLAKKFECNDELVAMIRSLQLRCKSVWMHGVLPTLEINTLNLLLT